MALSPLLFAMVMDRLLHKIRQESPWTIMFTDDIVICSECREQVEGSLETCRNRNQIWFASSGTIELEVAEVKIFIWR